MRLAAAAALIFALGGLCIIATFVPVLLSSFDEAVAITADVHRTTSTSLRDTIADNVRRSTTALEDLAAFYGRGDTWPSTSDQIDYIVRLYNHTGSMIEQVHTGRELNGDFVSLYRKQEPYRPYWRLSVRNATVPCRRSFDLDLATRAGPFIPGTERCSYDPRLRSWYAQLNTTVISSTLPEPMSDYPGVRVYIGRRVVGLFDTSLTLGVVHIDITTEFLVTALRRNPIGKSGIAWLSALSGTDDDAVYAISWEGESTTDLSQYNASALNPIVGVKSVAQLEHPLAREVVADLGVGLFRDGFTGDRLVERRSNGVLTTVVDIPAPQAPTLQLRLAVVIKESDYLSGIEQQRVVSITLAVVAVLVIAAIMSAVMWWIAAPLDVIADDMKEVAALRTRDDMRSTPSMITEVTKLQQSYAALSTAVSGFVRYVPKDVVRELVTTSQLGNLAMTPTRVTVLFTDIRGFTSICEAVSPDVLAGLVRMYFTTMTKAVASHGGVVDKFIGDAVMALWGAPIPVANMELLCTMCALWMQRKCTVPPLASTFSAAGHELAIRAGVAVGNVLAGNMGSAERMNYTVIGDSVNLAARLESLNKQFGTGIMVSADVAAAVDEYVVTRLLARVSVVGKVIPENIYEVVGAHKDLAVRNAEAPKDFAISVDGAAGIPAANTSHRNAYASEGSEHFDGDDDVLDDAALRAQELGLSHGADDLVVESPNATPKHQQSASSNGILTPQHVNHSASTRSAPANRSDHHNFDGSISMEAGAMDMSTMNTSGAAGRNLANRVAVILERAARRLTASDQDTRFATGFTQAVRDFHRGEFETALATLEMEVANAPKWRDHKSVLLVQRRIVAAIENHVDPATFDATFVADSK